MLLENKRIDAVRIVLMALVFVLGVLLLTPLFYVSKWISITNVLQRWVYILSLAGLLSALFTGWLFEMLKGRHPAQRTRRGVWYYPVTAGVLTLIGLVIGYTYLGMWPVGGADGKTGMIVDMHHQYAPLLAQLRETLLGGGDPLYNFHIGIGTSMLPIFGYYLASPLNLLLLIFPESLLPEGILVITLIKNALTAALFAACVQYIYRVRNAAVAAAAVMYGMMMYVLAYSWNVMWLDGVMMLPLVVLGFERLMRTGKYGVYVLSLAYTLYANYYIGFMVCLFLVLYYLVYFFRQRRSAGRRARSFGRFAAGSLMGGGLAMFLLVPVYLALGQTSAAGEKLPQLDNLFNMFGLLGQQLYGVAPTIRSSNLPNLYCGLLPVLLLPVFLTMREISLRRRLAYGGLLGVLGMSMVLNLPNLMWHGMHSPNDLPYRFSFVFCFALLLVAFETLRHIRQIRARQIGGALACVAAYLVIAEQIGEELSFKSIYVSLLLVVIYALVCLLAAHRKLAVRAASCLLLLVVTAEMTFGAGATFRKLDSQEHYTLHKNYVDNETVEAIRAAIGRAKEIDEQENGSAFYRMELLPRRTCVDTALFDYPGITTFASSNNYSTTKFMGDLGYAINGVNSYLYHSFVPATDSLLGIRYLVFNQVLNNHPQLNLVDSVTTGDTTYHIYENPYALPLGYFTSSAVRDWTYAYYNPIQSVNTLFGTMTGIDAASRPVYRFQKVEIDPDSQSIAFAGSTDTAFTINPGGETKTANFTVRIREPGQVYIYVDCRAAKSIRVSYGKQSFSVTPYEPYVIDAGTLGEGDAVSAQITVEGGSSGNIYVVTMDDEVFTEGIGKLAQNGLEITSMTDSHILGTVHAPEDGLLFTTIPYDAGWQVKVDGERVQTEAVAREGMLALALPAGDHEVEFTYRPRGLLLGAVLSVISLAAFILVLVHGRRRRAEKRLFAAETAGEALWIPTAAPEEIPASWAEFPLDEPPAGQAPPEPPGEPPADPPVTGEDGHAGP